MRMNFKVEFEQKLRQKLDEKAGNVAIISSSARDVIVASLLQIHAEGPKSATDYRLRNHYEVLRIGNDCKLIQKRKSDDIKLIASFEEVYDAIDAAHKEIGHGGERKTYLQAQKKWANLT